MKQFFFCLFFSLLTSTISWSQYGELSFQYRYGTPTKNFKQTTSLHYVNLHSNAQTQNDQGLVFTYSYPVWKKMNLGVHVGFEFAETKRSVMVIDPIYDYIMYNVPLNKNRVSYRFGVTKGFNLYDSKVKIVLGLTFLKRNYLVNNNVLTNGSFQTLDPKRDWIETNYNITTKYDEYHKNYYSGVQQNTYKHLNAEMSIAVKFQIIPNLFATLNVAYSRNYYVLFDQDNVYKYYDTNGSLTNIEHQYGVLYTENAYYGKRDHFLYTGIGLNYEFNFKKKVKPQI